MKKQLVVAFLFLSLLLGGCQARESSILSPYDSIDTIEGVWIEIDQDTITPCATEIIIHNTTGRDDLFYGLWFCMEEKRNDGWYALPILPDSEIVFPSVDIRIPSASELDSGFLEGIHYNPDSALLWERYPPNKMGYTWEELYGELPPGDYRLIIELSSELDIPISEDSPRYYLSAPFTLAAPES